MLALVAHSNSHSNLSRCYRSTIHTNQYVLDAHSMNTLNSSQPMWFAVFPQFIKRQRYIACGEMVYSKLFTQHIYNICICMCIVRCIYVVILYAYSEEPIYRNNFTAHTNAHLTRMHTHTTNMYHYWFILYRNI